MKLNTQDLDRENATGQNQQGANANRPLHLLTASSIIGDKVTNNNKEDLGKIKDIMLHISTGKVEYVIIGFGGFLGLGEKLFAVPFAALRVDAVNQEFILQVEKEFLDAAPGFDPEHWPETNSHYFDVNTYWGSFMGPHTSN